MSATAYGVPSGAQSPGMSHGAPGKPGGDGNLHIFVDAMLMGSESGQQKRHSTPKHAPQATPHHMETPPPLLRTPVLPGRVAVLATPPTPSSLTQRYSALVAASPVSGFLGEGMPDHVPAQASPKAVAVPAPQPLLGMGSPASAPPPVQAPVPVAVQAPVPVAAPAQTPQVPVPVTPAMEGSFQRPAVVAPRGMDPVPAAAVTLSELVLQKTQDDAVADAAAGRAGAPAPPGSKRRRYVEHVHLPADGEGSLPMEDDDDDDLDEEGQRQRKKARRLERNRTSAQRSRRRKKAYLDGLEKNVQVLCEENAELNAKVAYLSSAQQKVKEELTVMKSVVKSVLDKEAVPDDVLEYVKQAYFS